MALDTEAGRNAVTQAVLAQQGLLPSPQGFPAFDDFSSDISGDPYPLGSFQGGPDMNKPANAQRAGIAGTNRPEYWHGSSLSGGMAPGTSTAGQPDTTGYSNAVDPSDPSLGSPSFNEPGYSPASAFGRSGDDTSPSSKAAQESQAMDFAMSAFGRESATDRSATAPGWGSGPIGYSPDFSQATPNADIAITGGRTAPTGPIDVFESGYNDFFGAPPAGALPAPGMFDPNATFAPGGRTAVPGGAPPGRSFASPTPTPTPSDIVDPGAVAGWGGGIGGFSETSPGGYAGGPGSTAGFGAGYGGSAEMGNTQGAQGFTSGGSFEGGPGATGGGGGGSEGGGSSGGSSGGSEGGASGGSSGGSDPGGSPGGVG